MGIKDKIKAEIANIKAGYPEGHKSWKPLGTSRTLPWPQRTPEEEQKHQTEKKQKEQFKHQEQQAFQTSYRKARIAGARRRGRQAGLAQGGRGHGIMSALGPVSKGMNQAGEFGLQMQSNLGNMFGYSSPRPAPRPKTHVQSHKQRTITINGKTYARTDKEKPKPVQREPSIWDFP